MAEVYTLAMTVNERLSSTFKGIDRKKVKRRLIAWKQACRWASS
jgi:hypothetical protein